MSKVFEIVNFCFTFTNSWTRLLDWRSVAWTPVSANTGMRDQGAEASLPGSSHSPPPGGRILVPGTRPPWWSPWCCAGAPWPPRTWCCPPCRPHWCCSSPHQVWFSQIQWGDCLPESIAHNWSIVSHVCPGTPGVTGGQTVTERIKEYSSVPICSPRVSNNIPVEHRTPVVGTLMRK